MDIPLLPMTPRDVMEESGDTIQIYEDVINPILQDVEMNPDEIELEEYENTDMEEELEDYITNAPIQRERNIRTAWTTDDMIDKVVEDIIRGKCILRTLHQIRQAYKRSDRYAKIDTKSKIETAVRDKISTSRLEDLSKTLDNYFN